MSNQFQRIVLSRFLFVVIITNIPTFRTFIANEEDHGPLISLALRVCHKTIQLSEQASFFIADFNSDPSIPVLIQSLHDSSIPTVSTTHYRNLPTLIGKTQVRNILFSLDDLEKITSLILSSASREMRCREDCGYNEMKRLNSSSVVANSEPYSLSKLPRYCVTVDDYSQPIADKICDEQLFISSGELNGSSVLSDHNFNMTRGLYSNPIWNANNYLIFMLSKFGQDGAQTRHNAAISPDETLTIELYDELIFCFKFIWRFFRGLRTVICYEKGCSRYDYFAESITWYGGEEHEAYFDFSVTNMNGKRLTLSFGDTEGLFVADEHFYLWMSAVQSAILDQLVKSINGTRKDYDDYVAQFHDREIGQKLNVDLQPVEVGATVGEADLSRFDFSVGIETEAMCILTPHSELLSQGLVPFKVFTLLVWIFIGITVTAFTLVQYIFLKTQVRSFRGLYSETDILSYDRASAVHTVYAYFMCGSPPRLLLGKLFSGRILFTIFIFSALIISTIFLGGMTTLLTNTVQYPEIDTLEDLEDAGLFIQTPECESADRNFAQLGLSEALRSKVACNLRWYMTSMDELPRNSSEMKTDSPLEEVFVSKEFAENVRVIMENDAYLVALQPSLSSGGRVVLRKWPLREKYEYHLVAERLRERSYFYAFLKNSFLFDMFNRKSAQFLESGLVSKFYNSDLPDGPEVAPPPPEDDEPRPYTLNDLQLPFFSLVVGLLLSLLLFIAEVVLEDFEDLFFLRQIRKVL